MSKYIDADKLIAEIERRRLSNRYIDTEGYENELLEIITALQQEQPEVDFEKEYKSYMESRKDDLSGNAVTVNMKDLAHHFYELGLNAKKKE